MVKKLIAPLVQALGKRFPFLVPILGSLLGEDLGDVLKNEGKKLAKGEARAKLLQVWDKEIPEIRKGMRKKGMVPGAQPLEAVIRDALFRLWESVVDSGDLADYLRDTQDDKVVPLALQRLHEEMEAHPGTLSLGLVVEATKIAALDLLF